jgi:hypothetical protein
VCDFVYYHYCTQDYKTVLNENISLKSKVMDFQGQVTVTSKIVAHDTILEQVNTFMYLGCKGGKDTTSEISRFWEL